MTYHSITFIFFSTFSLLFFSFLKSVHRPWYLFLASALWYYSWGRTTFIIFFLILLFNFSALKLVRKISAINMDKYFLTLTLTNVLILIFLKLLPDLIPDTFIPYGTSFFMLMILGMIIDFWREPKKLETYNDAAFLTMPIFFPLLMAGPIERTRTFFPQFKNLNFSLEHLSDGIIIFSVGFLKRNFIADPLDDIFLLKSHSGNLLVDGLLDTFITYIIFSSYCDMGRGVARIFGIDLAVNFKAFYYSKNPNEFWQRWNITLGTWIRDYLTFPLMFRWGRTIGPNLIVAFSFLFVGLWHGLSFNWAVFGIFNGLIIYLYNVLNKKFSSPVHGYLLVACIWIGNGIFQHANFWQKFQIPFSWMPSLDFSRQNIPSLAVALILFFIYEYLQEKTGNTDFILKISKFFKYSMVIALLALFIYALTLNSFFKITEDTPPVYFMI